MKFKRREFIALTGIAGTILLVRRYITGGIISIAPPASSMKTSEITPNDEFYITNYDATPEVSLEDWSLRVTGEVEKELTMDLEELKKLEETVDYNTLICIGNGIGGNLIGNAKWKGVRLGDVLEIAGLRETARDIALYGADGYMDTFPVSKALHPDTRLVYEMNDEPLPVVHGFPLRIVVPGLYGIKNVKWLTEIRVTAEDELGFWQKRGWSEEATIKVMSRIDVPREGDLISERLVEISGIAFAGEHPIKRVEVSTDGGETWKDAKLLPALSRYAWTLWSMEWRIPSNGDYELMSRAIDESGRIQEEGTIVSRRSFPDGAEGYHRIRVKRVSI